MLQVKPIKTDIFRSEQCFEDFLVANLSQVLKEGDILAVTSKVVSIAENRFVSREETLKEELVKQEADIYLGACKYDCHLTIKQGLLIPSAGIDESNSENDSYILYPKDPFLSAKKIYSFLTEELKLKSLGVILTDSHTTPLRKGVVGAALAYFGFRGVLNQVGTTDLFGRKMKMTHINIADAIATSATLMMGEGGESCPLAIIKYPAEFLELPNNNEIKISIEEDLYQPILRKE